VILIPRTAFQSRTKSRRRAASLGSGSRWIELGPVIATAVSDPGALTGLYQTGDVAAASRPFIVKINLRISI